MSEHITIIHYFDVEGRDTFHVPAGVDIEVLSIDERAPGDRVYRRGLMRETPEIMAMMIGPGPAGHAGDARHEAIRRRVLGLPLLEVVKEDGA